MQHAFLSCKFSFFLSLFLCVVLSVMKSMEIFDNSGKKFVITMMCHSTIFVTVSIHAGIGRNFACPIVVVVGRLPCASILASDFLRARCSGLFHGICHAPCLFTMVVIQAGRAIAFWGLLRMLYAHCLHLCARPGIFPRASIVYIIFLVCCTASYQRDV